MAEDKMIRLGQASRKLNVGHNTILEFLAKKGFSVENNPNAKLSPDQFAMLSKEFASSASEKMEASNLTIGTKHAENVTIQNEVEVHRKKAEEEERIMIKNLGSKEVVKAKEKEVVKEEPKPEKVEAALSGPGTKQLRCHFCQRQGSRGSRLTAPRQLQPGRKRGVPRAG